jgi:hypothetical protein
MKKLLFISLLFLQLLPSKGQAQNKASTAAAVATAGVIAGLLIANSVENIKEGFERNMLEWVLANKQYSEKVEFELKLIKWEATKKEDLSMVSVIGYLYKEKNKEPIILLNSCSPGWMNDNGVNFNYVNVYEIKKEYWDKLMESYINLAISDNPFGKININDILTFNDNGRETRQTLSDIKNITNNFIEFEGKNGKSKLSFKVTENGDTHIVQDFDDKFIMDFNEGNFNLFIKNTKDIIRIKRSFLVEATKILYNIKTE